MYTIVDLCFLCLTNDKNLNSLLSEDSDGVNVEDKLKFVISKHLNYDKEMSTYICSPCLKELNYVYNYTQLCLRNINRFNSFIQKLRSSDEPYQNLQVKLIDLKNQTTCGNDIRNEPATLICEVDNGTEQKYVNRDDTIIKMENPEVNEEILTEESEDHNSLEFIDEIIKEESVDICDTIDIKSELDNQITCVNDIRNEPATLICELDNGTEQKYVNKDDTAIKIENPEVNEEILTEESEDHNSLEFIDEIIKEESVDICDTIDIKSELDNQITCVNDIRNEPATLICELDNGTEQKYVNKDDTAIKIENPEVNEEILTEESEDHNSLEFIDEIIKEESVDICDTIDIKSELDNDSHSKQNICDVCDKRFQFFSALVEHKHIHTGIKPYKCDACSKEFSHKSSLNRHIRVHTGEKPYQCNVCGKAFSHLTTLVVHERIHNGAKPFKCDLCDKAFGRKSYMVSHRLSHTGEKPYKCNMCEKPFRHLTTLKTHRRMHSGIKPFKCDICHKAFTRKFNFMAHKLICHIKNKECE